MIRNSWQNMTKLPQTAGAFFRQRHARSCLLRDVKKERIGRKIEKKKKESKKRCYVWNFAPLCTTVIKWGQFQHLNCFHSHCKLSFWALIFLWRVQSVRRRWPELRLIYFFTQSYDTELLTKCDQTATNWSMTLAEWTALHSGNGLILHRY